MATYGQRDKFIQTLVTFTTSEQAKALTAPERQDLLLKIRDKYAPELSNDDWAEIAQGVNNFKFVITDTVKYGEVPHIEDQLPIVEQEQEVEQEVEEQIIVDEEVDEAESSPTITEPTREEIDEKFEESVEEDGVTEEDDYDEPKREEPVPEPESKQFGKFVAPKEVKPGKINTTRLKGLLKPKKKD